MRLFPPPRRQRRPGVITLLLLLALAALLALVALALDPGILWSVRTEARAAADAAALAATQTLADDDQLRNDPSLLPPLLARAAAQGDLFAYSNLVNGQPLTLQPNPNNQSDGDLVFGTLDVAAGGQFTPAGDITDPSNPALPSVNAVRVTARLTRARGTAPALVFGPFTALPSADVQVSVTALLDRDVIGFRPLGEQSLPLAPLALFADPSGNDPNSWQFQVNERNGADQYRFDPQQQAFVADANGDGIPEFEATLPLDASQAGAGNVSLLYLGVPDAAGAAGQLLTGVLPAQLQDFGGQLLLGSNNQLTVPGTAQGPDAGDPAATQLWDNLDQLRQQAAVRIWPLYCSFDSGTGNPVLCGFVAARIAALEPLTAGQPLRFTLQPTMIASGTAVTDASRRNAGGISIVNPFICKVRLVE